MNNVAARPAKETRFERSARLRAAYAAYVADGGTLTEGAWLSAEERAMASVQAPTPAAAPVARASAPSPSARRVDRVWDGGDRDSDDIYTTGC